MIERLEIKMLSDNGYKWDNLFDIIKIFEKKISHYTGAPYVTVTDSCTHALELALRYEKPNKKVQIPNYTYISVPMTLTKLNIDFEFVEKKWQGYYTLWPSKVVDMAVRFTKDCYIPETHSCLSFDVKKVLKINKGGAILTDDVHAHEYFQKARHDGRDLSLSSWNNQKEFDIGYHYNLSIEDCARGILLMDELAKFGPINKDSVDNCAVTYPNLKTVTLKFTE